MKDAGGHGSDANGSAGSYRERMARSWEQKVKQWAESDAKHIGPSLVHGIVAAHQSGIDQAQSVPRSALMGKSDPAVMQMLRGLGPVTEPEEVTYSRVQRQATGRAESRVKSIQAGEAFK